MPNRFETMFASLKESGRKAFIPYTILGYPSRQACLETIQTMIKAGANAIELGIAFSDPMADGPLIQKCAKETIESGFGLADAFSLIAEIREFAPEIPIALLVYFNTVIVQGIERFYQRVKTAGADAVLIADMNIESSYLVQDAARASGISHVLLASPMSGKERLARIAEQSQGFIYVVSRLGITGVEENYDSALQETVNELKRTCDVPICIGFGISSPSQAKKMIDLGADGVITGSKVLQLQQASNAEVQEFVESMVSAVALPITTSLATVSPL